MIRVDYMTESCDHDITIAFPLGREFRQACSRWYNTLEVVGTEVEDNFTGRRLTE